MTSALFHPQYHDGGETLQQEPNPQLLPRCVFVFVHDTLLCRAQIQSIGHILGHTSHHSLIMNEIISVSLLFRVKRLLVCLDSFGLCDLTQFVSEHLLTSFWLFVSAPNVSPHTDPSVRVHLSSVRCFSGESSSLSQTSVLLYK